MPLLNQLSMTDSLWEFERAYPDRLRDARALRENRPYWGIYTFGYVVEIVLKAAYCRIQHVLPYGNIKALIFSATQRAGQLRVSRPRNLHDLVFWARLLIAERAARNTPLDTIVANRSMANVVVIAENWIEGMRYRDSISASVEYAQVAEHVSWIVQAYPNLWRV